MASRSKERAEEAIARLKVETSNEAIFLQLDLASWDSVKRASDELQSCVILLISKISKPILFIVEIGKRLQFMFFLTTGEIYQVNSISRLILICRTAELWPLQ